MAFVNAGRIPGTVAGRVVRPVILGVWLTLAASFAVPQTKPQTAPGGETVMALMVSDIHFDPFLDPAKLTQLATTDIKEWRSVLAAAPSADRELRYSALEKACPTRGDDTSYALLDSSLQAIHKEAGEARFVTVSGDLLAHSFICKYSALFPHAAPGDYRAFVEKTLIFVVEQVRAALPGVPVYVALGNNDSDCGDYKLDAHSDFLAAMGEELTRDFPASERRSAQETFAAGGYFSARFPAPIRDARLVVLDDIFMSRQYSTCAGKPDTNAGDAQLAWLAQQLSDARHNHEKVWVMAHIPPGVDVYSSVKHLDGVCGGNGVKMFLSSEKLAEVLAQFSDVVALAIFAHTHMDEVRVLPPENAGGSAAPAKGVAGKLVSSISPINGNTPSFTLAYVDPSSAALEDFRVFAASNATGIETTWREEYDWRKTYHESAFSAAGVSKEIAGFQADTEGKTVESRDYIGDFYVGNSQLLSFIWPQYVCGLSNDSAQAYKACACPAAK